MAVLSHEYRYIYFGPWGTGSTSVIQALCSRAAGVLTPAADLCDPGGAVRCPSKHTKPRELRQAGLLPPPLFDGFLKFTCVRNPYDFLYSEWMRSRSRWSRLKHEAWTGGRKGESIAAAARLSFPDWVRWELADTLAAGRQGRLYRDWSDGVDRLMRFERLAEDFAAVVDELGIPGPVVLEHENRTDERYSGVDRTPYREAYDADARALVATVYRDELAHHGYDF